MDSMVSEGGRSAVLEGGGAPGAAGLAASGLGGSGFAGADSWAGGTCSNGLGGLGCCGAGCCWLKRGAASRPISAASRGTMDARRHRGLENCIYTGFLSTLRLIFIDVLPRNWVSRKTRDSGDSTAT